MTSGHAQREVSFQVHGEEHADRADSHQRRPLDEHGFPTGRSLVSHQHEFPRFRRAIELVFPFLKLKRSARARGVLDRFGGESVGNVRTEEVTFFIMGLVYVVTVMMFVYLLLTISCWHFEIEDGDVELNPRAPGIGSHYAIVILVKEIIQVAVLHRLCGVLMEPMVDLYEHRTDPCRIVDDNGVEISLLDETAGVVRFFLTGIRGFQFQVQRLVSKRAQRPPKMWLTTFVADHILLFGVGVGAICHQITLLYLKYKARRSVFAVELAHYLGMDWTMDVLLALACIHMAIQVMGFLYTTLESNVVPKKERKKEFALFMSLFIFLWMVDFLAIVLERQVFTASFQAPIPYIYRFWAAVAQIFVSHSTVMLGAVFMGHSCHFMKCPDIEWKVLLTNGIPFCLALGAYIWCIGLRRLHHLEVSCASSFVRNLIHAWPKIDLSLDIFAGIILLALAFWNGKNGIHTELENGELLKVFDYDKALVFFTFAASILYFINQIFFTYGTGLHWSWAASILKLIGPIGLSSFTVSVWRWPPRLKSGGLQGRILGVALWFALFTAGSQFVSFQDKEDCEICSDLPGCCNYPFLHDFNHAEDRWKTCDRDLRCSEAHWSDHLNKTMYCVLPEHKKEHSSMTDMEYRLHKSFSPEECRILKDRWSAFVDDRAALQAEVEHEEESLASTFRLINLLGQAASVEMYFTIFGVLLKVIFRSWHKHSEHILELGHHQHHEDDHGNHATVVVGRCAGITRSSSHNDLSASLRAQALDISAETSTSTGTGISLH